MANNDPTNNSPLSTSDIGDESLRDELYEYLKFNSSRVVNSIVELRSLLSARNQRAQVLGYYTPGDGGGGHYFVDPEDTTSLDNGSTVILATDGARWKLATTKKLDIRQWGAKADGVTDSSPFIQNAFTAGGAQGAQNGVYRLGATVVADYSGVFPEVTYPSRRLDFRGDGAGNTIFELATGQNIAFKLTGTDPTAVNQGIHAQDRIGGFSIYPQGHPYPEGHFGFGLYLLNKAGTVVEDIATEYLTVGCEMDGVLSSVFTNLAFKNGIIGMMLNSTALTLPNGNTFNSLVWSGNSQVGLVANTLGAGNKIIGGKVEQNGTQGVSGNGGIILNLSGLNGLATLHLDTVYFEGNAGDADLKIDNISSLPVTVKISNCTFNRNSDKRFTTSNIIVTSSGGGLVKVVLDANGHYSIGGVGGYVPSAERPFIQHGSNVEIIGWDTCVYNETTSIPSVV
ncbi:hypothetical protein ABQX22_14220 [Xanthomonas sp. WHRI 1810A]|uniref:hypothetical protein n=1 Tax=Xanthomonas sp. WHRI 1810A TaxID=3161565 RepID=UPI0032E88575